VRGTFDILRQMFAFGAISFFISDGRRQLISSHGCALAPLSIIDAKALCCADLPAGCRRVYWGHHVAGLHRESRN
jgi:hypothetical protein